MIVVLRTANAEQEQSWNGNSGQAWIALQDTLDAMFKPFQDLLAEKVRMRRAGNSMFSTWVAEPVPRRWIRPSD
jgi:hypothetical protein